MRKRPSAASAPYAGLENLGNTCYANSALQVLALTPTFADALGKLLADRADSDPSNELAHELGRLYATLSNDHTLLAAADSPNKRTNGGVSADTSGFFSTVKTMDARFADTRKQQDVQEFLRFLLAYLQDLDASRSPSGTARVLRRKRSARSVDTRPTKRARLQDGGPRPTFVENLFAGVLEATTMCERCGSKSVREESFLDLSLPVEKGRSLHWALAQLVTPERLTGQNKYQCSACEAHTDALRSVRIASLPPILTIHLKRFAVRHKVPFHMDVPFQLDLKDYCAPECKRSEVYELYAVIFHKGSASSCGHYTAVVQDPAKANAWVMFDDKDANYLSESQLHALMCPHSASLNTAYVLFYRAARTL